MAKIWDEDHKSPTKKLYNIVCRTAPATPTLLIVAQDKTVLAEVAAVGVKHHS